MSGVQIRVCGRYRLESILRKNENHTLYVARNVQTLEEVVIKSQQSKNRNANTYSLLQQGKVLQSLQGGIGIPTMHWCGQQQDYNFIVMEYLGKSLFQLFNICDKKFTLKTVLMIGSQIINILQYFHFKNYIYRNVRPENFLIGSGKKNHKLFVIDYSMTRRYRDSKTLQHYPYKQSALNMDNLIFSSLNVNSGCQSSRRDDIQSLLLMMIYFLKGSLPWQLAQGNSQDAKQKNTFNLKKSTTIDVLCKDLPKEFKLLLKYIRQLKFEEKPDYTYIKNIFKQRMDRQGMLDDFIFDWILIPPPIIQPNYQNYIPISLQIIPNEQQFIKMHLQMYNKQVEQNQTNNNNQSEVKTKNPKPIQEPATEKKIEQKIQKKEKQCIIF